ncbi:MAG: hypothetical protein EHM61_04995 [Acidobacteria bacterium]|nr:MAG: hypothetical protein EHM61_04995 [Acidobacteriota bacterium]
MTTRMPLFGVSLLVWILAVLPVITGDQVIAQTKVSPGFNLFSPEQDVEIGRQSAAEVEKQLPLLNDRGLQNYVSDIGQRLAAGAPGPKFPYQFKVVNVSDVNAFALPGGFMYINRGLVDSAHDEAELAGVMAHEMSHVALRHGTNQASKAYLAQAGLGVLGGVLGNGTTGQIMGAIGGFGLNTLFLKFGRDDEEQADVLGAQIMASAGYDPMAMSRMFETLRQQAGRDPSKFEQFFSSHPAPKNRAERIQKEASMLGSVERRGPVGDFNRIQARLEGMPPAPSMQQLVQRGPAPGGQTRGGNGQPVRVSIERPSSRMKTFENRDGFFQIRYPENWRAYESKSGYGATLAPEGGIVDAGNGQPSIVYGVIVNHYVPFQGRSGNNVSLEDATDDLIEQISRSNPNLQVASGSKRQSSAGGKRTLGATLSGESPVTGQEERVTLQTQELPDGHIIYALFIAPGRYYDDMSQVMSAMIGSLRVDEHADHQRAE